MPESEVLAALPVSIASPCLRGAGHDAEQAVVAYLLSSIANLQRLLYVHHLCLAARLLRCRDNLFILLRVLLHLRTIRQATTTTLAHLTPSLLQRGGGAALAILLQHHGRQFMRVRILLHDGVGGFVRAATNHDIGLLAQHAAIVD